MNMWKRLSSLLGTKDRGQVGKAGGTMLVIIGAITIFIGLLVFAEVNTAIIGASVSNESLGAFSGNVSAFTVASPGVNRFQTFAVRNVSTTMTRNDSFDIRGCSNVPCYTWLDFVTGQINVTLGYGANDEIAQGQDGSTDVINIDYFGPSNIRDQSTSNTLTTVTTSFLTAIVLLGVSLIVLGASVILGIVGGLAGSR